VAPWLIGAITLLRTAGGRAIALVTGRTATAAGLGATGGALATGGLDGGGDGFLGFGGGDDRPRRRRRRRALTQGDRDDIAFITALLGAPAGKMFATTLASRGR